MISKYRACVRTQGAKVEMIDNLFKPVSGDVDEGIIRFAYFNSLNFI
jgi:eukaryotic translation initiation factor 2C